MSQRERQSARATAKPTTGSASPPRPPAQAIPVERPGLWEECYRSAAPELQAELLAQARRQDVLYAHQLRHTANGPATERASQFLALLRNGKTALLEPNRPADFTPVDGALDNVQREAVGKALATTDLCLIQGLPGTGKSRVTAELVTQAALRGGRVLLVAPAAAAIDRVLEQVADRDALLAVRCLAKEERGDDLAPALQGMTFDRRLRQLTEHTLPEARREAEAVAQTCQKLAQAEAVLDHCLELAETSARLQAQTAAMEKDAADTPEIVERELRQLESGDGVASPLAEAVRSRDQAFKRIDAALADLRRRGEDGRRELERQAPQRSSLAPLVEAKRNGRWWTASWWRAAFAGDILTKWDALESVHRSLQDDLAGIDEESRRLEHEREQADRAYQAERQRQAADETARRQAVLDERLSSLRAESAVAAEKWQRTVQELEPAALRPVRPDADQVRSAQEDCRRQRKSLEDRAAFAREWLECLTSQAGNFPAWLAGRANLVAIPTGALAADPHFGDATSSVFDLIIVEEAHRLTEAEFAQLARRARRWVLVGEPERGEPSRTDPPESPARKGKPAARLPAPRLFAELWRQLHCDPRRLPYVWLQEEGRLCCRLRAVAAEDRRWLETERVADFPDIELRILALPRQKPLLAEVVFPPSMALAQAKEYIYRELQELPVRALGHSFRWVEEPERVVLRLSEAPVASPLPVALEPGVREMVGLAGPEGNGARPGFTCRLEFDRSAGWDRARAEEWTGRHLSVRDPGRTIRLDVPYRMQDPALAAFISELLYAGGYHAGKPAANGAAGENGHAAPVEFVSVPSAAAEPAPRKPDNGKRPVVTRGRPTRTGAGLELDMAEPSHRSRLPADLRQGLPDRGIVNLLEAQAVVRYLEGLAARDGAATVGVMALYPAQVALIRALVQRSTRLGGLDLRIGEPAAFRERECGVVLLSLTRSHHHRAVTYGEGPHVLGLALTRARRKLVLFGDPGTLARRREWDGPVDHLDDGASAWERDVIARLIRQLDGAAPPAAPIPEGSHA